MTVNEADAAVVAAEGVRVRKSVTVGCCVVLCTLGASDTGLRVVGAIVEGCMVVGW